MQEKVELSVAIDVQRRKIDGVGFQQSKSLERIARLLDQLGQACTDLATVEPLTCLPEQRFKDYGKLVRRVRKSLALVVIHPEQSTTRQGLKIGRQATKSLSRLAELTDQRQASETDDPGLHHLLHFQLKRMLHLQTELADALLASNFGPAVRLQNYKQLKNAAHALTTDSDNFGVERLALTRSGSTIAGLKAGHSPADDIMAVYKEGQAHKVLEEIDGVDQWKKVFPKVAPTVISHHIKHDEALASMVIEHLPGTTLESMLLNEQWDAARLLLKKLSKTLRKIWKASWTRERCQPGYMQQLRARMPEVRQTHPELFNGGQSICGLPRPRFDALVDQVAVLEKRLAAPFSVLIHGDFNVDNLLFDELKNRIYFIDLHRASYSDYVQDLSVLMVSIYRLPILDAAARAEMMALIKQLYHFARRFAQTNDDVHFDVRLAIGLARSFATSTRFIYDRRFARQLAFRARYLLETITHLNPEQTDNYRLPLEDIFSD